MRKRLIIVSCAVLLVLIFFVASESFLLFQASNKGLSSIPYRSKTDLLLESDVIINGIVKNSERDGLQTYTIIDIKEVIKGKPYDNKSIKFRQNGGKYILQTVSTEDFIELANGDEVLLFLADSDKGNKDNYNPDEKYYILTGYSQAIFILEQNESDEKVFKNIYAPIYEFNLSNIKEDLKNAIENP